MNDPLAKTSLIKTQYYMESPYQFWVVNYFPKNTSS